MTTRIGPVAVLAAVMAVSGSCRTRYRIPVEHGGDLTQDVALKVSKRAIQLAGYDSRRAEPACYWHRCDERSPYFARNESDPDSGYVLWRLTDRRDGAAWHLFVRVQMQAGHVECTVSEPH